MEELNLLPPHKKRHPAVCEEVVRSSDWNQYSSLLFEAYPLLWIHQYRTEGMNAPLGSLYKPRLIRVIG